MFSLANGLVVMWPLVIENRKSHRPFASLRCKVVVSVQNAPHSSSHLYSTGAGSERTSYWDMIEALLQQLAGRITGSTKGEAAARQLYLDINISGLKDENEEGKAASFDKHKDAILPVLIKGELQQQRQCYSSSSVCSPPRVCRCYMFLCRVVVGV